MAWTVPIIYKHSDSTIVGIEAGGLIRDVSKIDSLFARCFGFDAFNLSKSVVLSLTGAVSGRMTV